MTQKNSPPTTSKVKTTKPIQQLNMDELLEENRLLKIQNEEQAKEINHLNDYITEQELEKKVKFLIATAKDGKKYELHFMSMQLEIDGVLKSITAEMVKNDDELLDRLISLKSIRIKLLKNEKGGVYA